MTTREEYTIRCDLHTYLTLEFNGKLILCLDNDFMYAEAMISKIEKRTGMNFKDITIKGRKDDFQGLRFLNGGLKRDFWGKFPSKTELEYWK